MTPATAALLINGIVALMAALPQIIASIQAMDAPDEDKQALLARIRTAQVQLSVWE